MRTVKIRNKRLKRRSRLQRGGSEITYTVDKKDTDIGISLRTMQDRDEIYIGTSSDKNILTHNRLQVGNKLIKLKIDDDIISLPPYDNYSNVISRLIDSTGKIEFIFDDSINYYTIERGLHSAIADARTDMMRQRREEATGLAAVQNKPVRTDAGKAAASAAEKIFRPHTRDLLGGKRKSKRKSRKRKSHRRKTRRY